MRNNKHTKTAIIASIVYALFIMGLAWVLKNNGDMSAAAQIAVAMVSIIPGAVFIWAHIRQVNGMGEFERKMQLDSLSIAAGGTAIVTISYSFLEIAGFPKLSTFFIAPLISGIWIVSIIAQTLWHTRGTSKI